MKAKIPIFLLALTLAACSSTKQSAKYYKENKSAVLQLKEKYEALYKLQAFAIGFVDESFTYYFYEIETDSIRYIYNNQDDNKLFKETAVDQGLSPTKIKKLADEMKKLGCIWMDKIPFYKNDESVIWSTHLSFKSKTFNYLL